MKFELFFYYIKPPTYVMKRKYISSIYCDEMGCKVL